MKILYAIIALEIIFGLIVVSIFGFIICHFIVKFW